MTVSSAAAASAAAQAYQTAHSASNNAKTAGAAFSAVANQSDLLPGISASGGSTLSSNMLSALLGMNSGSASPPTMPNSAGSNASGQHHRGIGSYVENLPTTATGIPSPATS